jgi:hypothetical protein
MTCFFSVEAQTGLVFFFLKVISYSVIGVVGSMKPYFALRITQRSATDSAYSRFTLNGAPVYASRAGVGPRCGCFFQILLRPHGTITRSIEATRPNSIYNRPTKVSGILSELCKWLHEQLERLPLITFPFEPNELPENGVYLFYERGEYWGHGGAHLRIVRIGTHRDGNFRSRIAEHFLLDERKMTFSRDQSAPHDRSIFRKNIGRSLLNRAADSYLPVWELDFMKRAVCESHRHLRDIEKEVATEREVTRILRESFSFRCIEVAEEVHRLGNEGIERALIGTLASCRNCVPSPQWLGHYSPKPQIRESGLWLVQHLKAAPLSPTQQGLVMEAIDLPY